MSKTHRLLLALVLAMGGPLSSLAADSVTCWFPPGWQAQGEQAKAITTALSENSGVEVRPRIAKSYPEILEAFSTNDANLVYVGSFVQTIIRARELGTPLAQTINGKEMYGSWMVYPTGGDPKAILASSPENIAFAVGASSGESGAKAATAGKASIGTANHGAAVSAVKAGKATAAFVKSWWWEANKDKFAGFDVYQVPGVSDSKNPDNVLTASKAVPADLQSQLKKAAIESKAAFGGASMAEFDSAALEFSLGLMKQGKIDPLAYAW